MVLLHEYFDALKIYEADRQASIAALGTPGSRARNERGALAVSKFRFVCSRWAPSTPESRSAHENLLHRTVVQVLRPPRSPR